MRSLRSMASRSTVSRRSALLDAPIRRWCISVNKSCPASGAGESELGLSRVGPPTSTRRREGGNIMATIRKSAFALTAAERNLYISVITQLNSGPTPTPYGQLVADHRDMSHRMHGNMGPGGRQRFLSWHRD